eukprot:CAMPEP_0113387360 /NCGR_PEP_ID=MMETSP0013_2-20120614/8493_1 /TAXON_ID=2843 ORGANISM="Skeletonema costatum, Strain 1716" /NCGR_SAMPLE_ID=MMETSP0013_2 /ASSEMBLY_ACC=CAM_ASM_000158 /LENGTH=854 /DNA_ID=CAMNT_0000270247 /DNA_START=112 /DNA_END=2676 /DNA_ORIENTATION=+ /assembly_acc=CAM_ASM_000158
MVLASTGRVYRLLSSATILLSWLSFQPNQHLSANAFSTTISVDTSSIVRLRPDGSANDILYNLLQQQEQQQTDNNEEQSSQSPTLVLEGFISKRRAIGKHLIFLDVMPVDKVPTLDISSANSKNNKKKGAATLDGDDSLSEIVPVQAIMRRDFWNGIQNQTTDNNNNNSSTTMSSFDVYHKIIQPGTYCRIQGQVGPSRNQKEAILFCHSITYTLANNNPQHLRNALKFVQDGVLDATEVLNALPILSQVEELTPSLSTNDNQTYGELAMEILDRFPRKFLMNPSQLMGSSDSAKVQLLPPVPVEFRTPPSQIAASGGSSIVDQQQDDDDDDDMITITQALLDRNNEQVTDQKKAITITGWIQNRRRYQDSVSVLEVVDEFSSLASSTSSSDTEESNDDGSGKNELDMRNSKLKDLWKQRIYAVLHPSALGTRSEEELNIYGNILSSGARVTMQGFMMMSSDETSRESNGDDSSAATFWVTKCRLLRSSWRPGDIRQLLDLVHDGKFDVEEAAGALEIPYSQVEDLAEGTTSAAERQWLTAEVTQSLQGENSRVGKISDAMMQSLATFGSARDEYPIQDVTSLERSDDDGSQSTDTASILESNEGNPRRTSLEGSRWQYKKRPQLEFMVDQIAEVLRSHPDYGKRKLNVVDIGGGKGLLSNLLAETFGDDVVVQVIEISRAATVNGMMRAKRRGLENIRFDAMDATKVDVQSNKDVVVALHACGVLSDVALGHAVSQGAGFVICPCCFRSNPHLRVSIPKEDNGNLDVELVTAEEFLDVDPDQYTSLKQLAELQGDIKLASKAMHTVNALRASAVDRLWQSKKGSQERINTSVKTFPIGFSTRNFCLVGKYDVS